MQQSATGRACGALLIAVIVPLMMLLSVIQPFPARLAAQQGNLPPENNRVYLPLMLHGRPVQPAVPTATATPAPTATATPAPTATATPAPTATPTATPEPGDACATMGAEVSEMARLMADDAQQGRPTLTCDARLMQAAQAHAEDMAARGFFSHTNPDGIGSNERARRAGYRLPDFYSTGLTANEIESLGGGGSVATPAGMWQVWMGSSIHQQHLLGLNTFYASQVEYGIGYVADPASDLRYYWVVVTAAPGP